MATAPLQPPNEHDQQVVEKLIADIQSGEGKAKGIFPEKWTPEIQSREILINDVTGENYPGGIAYGAICSRQLKQTFPEIAAFFAKGGVAEKLVRKVKTLVNVSHLAQVREGTIQMQTEIDVPVVSNFSTEVEVAQRKVNDRKLTVEWKQLNGWGSLTYNQGTAIIEPDGDRAKMTVIGVHIIKEANKVPWIGRATASSFAKSHYCNFIRAVDAYQQEM